MRDTDIICPPYAPVLMESTRAIGYSMEAAIADIIDNSIAAGANTISVFYDVFPKPYIAICDNGKGMDDDELTHGMRYGSCSPTEERGADDLGRYGLGMKTASLSQCRCLSVISSKNGIIIGRRWDLDHIIETQDWSLMVLSPEEINEIEDIETLKEYESGTLVVWANLDKVVEGSVTIDKALENKMIETKKHLELVFHRFLSGDGVKRIKIFINGVQLVPFDPFFGDKSFQEMDDETIEVPGRQGKVVVRPYILPHPSKMTKDELEKYGGKDGLRNLQGFYIYRNKRLLTWGTWFKLIKMDEFSKLARVRVDIPNSLDDLWTLDIKKSTAYPPEIVKTRLKQLVKTMSNGSRRTWNFRQKSELRNNITTVWDKVETRDGVKYVINMNHPILNTIKESLDEDSKKLLMQYLETVQNNLLFNNLHHDLSTDVKIVKDKESDECSRVKLMAKSILREAIKNGNDQEVLKNFETIEPFLDYMDEIREVYAEVKTNG